MPRTFTDLDPDCKIDILKHLDSFHSLQVFIEAYPRLYPILQANLTGIYRRILTNSFQLDPWDLVYQAAGSPPIVEGLEEWKERRGDVFHRYQWPAFVREYTNDSGNPCLWLMEYSDDEYMKIGTSPVTESSASESEEYESGSEAGNPGHMSNPEAADNIEDEETDAGVDDDGDDDKAQEQQEVNGEPDTVPPLPEARPDGGIMEEDENDADDDNDDDGDDDDNLSEDGVDFSLYAGYPRQGPNEFTKTPPSFPIPRVKTSTMYILCAINHLPMRVFQIYRKYMLCDPSANSTGAKSGFHRLSASADELSRFKRGFLLFYIYRNLYREVHGIKFKNLAKRGYSSGSTTSTMSDEEMEDKGTEAAAEDKPAKKSTVTAAEVTSWQDDKLLYFLRNLSQRDMAYFACVNRIIVSMAELLGEEMQFTDNRLRLIDTLFESETASGYTSLTRVLDQFHGRRQRKINKLLQSVSTYYDKMIPDLISKIEKVAGEKGVAKGVVVDWEEEGIWDKGGNGESLWVAGPPAVRPLELWINDLPDYFNEPKDAPLFI